MSRITGALRCPPVPESARPIPACSADAVRRPDAEGALRPGRRGPGITWRSSCGCRSPWWTTSCSRSSSGGSSRSAGTTGPNRGELPVRPDRRGARPGPGGARGQPVRGPGAGAAGAVPHWIDASPSRVPCDPEDVRGRDSATGAERLACSTSWARRSTLRNPCFSTAIPATARRRSPRRSPRCSAASCTCRTPWRSMARSCWSYDPVYHHEVVETEETIASGRAALWLRTRPELRPALCPGQAAGGPHRRRADAGSARPAVRPAHQAVSGAVPGEGQRRRADRRRLRPAAGATRGTC